MHCGIIISKYGGLFTTGNLLFQISPDFVTFETNFGDSFLNQSYVTYVGLNLYLITENQKNL